MTCLDTWTGVVCLLLNELENGKHVLRIQLQCTTYVDYKFSSQWIYSVFAHANAVPVQPILYFTREGILYHIRVTAVDTDKCLSDFVDTVFSSIRLWVCVQGAAKKNSYKEVC